ncbi:DUF1513 domain-containing protein [Aquincola sp. J276]|uniref:DUF1513 domain-containing protein n=1 Tax=Aquincola sp. J276 TaxID=2898432 RepID=UPI00215129FA|nr:DUF1513 domain-containing protein [Aquincola sp. J276]MCR5866622.1 DUF1513 domain-containing protein [Aquincola sp. J276]
MPMATERSAGLPRRRLLQAGLAAATAAGLPRLAVAAHGPSGRVFAAWDLSDGRHQIGCLRLPASDGAACQVIGLLDVPTRAHGLLPLPDGGVLVAARRPGEWLLRWHPAQPQAAQWHWIDGDRAFSGHVQPWGGHLYTTEADLETGDGLLVRRDARTLERLAEWPTGGVDNHALLPDGRGGLFVANGGVATRPETGRLKLDLAGMDSSIVRIDAASGAITHQWRLADRRLSLRHLAWRGDDLGIALQAQHDDADSQQQAPVLALLRGARGAPAAAMLVALSTPQPLGGYGGDICATPAGWFVSCPRVDAVAGWSAGGRWQGVQSHTQAYALVAAGNTPWVAGPGGWRALDGGAPALHPWQAAREPDNHAAWSGTVAS